MSARHKSSGALLYGGSPGAQVESEGCRWPADGCKILKNVMYGIFIPASRYGVWFCKGDKNGERSASPKAHCQFYQR
jgi:hypothetical protein